MKQGSSLWDCSSGSQFFIYIPWRKVYHINHPELLFWGVWRYNSFCQSVLQHIGSLFLRSEDNFGSGTGPVFLGSLDCRRPDDNTLLNCTRFSPLGLPRFGHERDVGVHCEGISTYVLSMILSHCVCGYFCIWNSGVGSSYILGGCHCLPTSFYLSVSEPSSWCSLCHPHLVDHHLDNMTVLAFFEHYFTSYSGSWLELAT